jgi:hypothetical protein
LVAASVLSLVPQQEQLPYLVRLESSAQLPQLRSLVDLLVLSLVGSFHQASKLNYGKERDSFLSFFLTYNL